MKATKRLMTWLLALAMVFSLLPMPARAEETVPETVPEAAPAAAAETLPEAEPDALPETERVTTVIPFQVNPLYAGIVSESDFRVPDFPKPDPAQADPQGIYYQTAEEAGSLIRSKMKSRTESFTIYVKASHSNRTELANEMMEYALKHTGNATEGDYLMWQYGGWKAEVTREWNEDTQMYQYSYAFVFSYYTTYDQELRVTTEINNLIANLGIRYKSDYEKICGVYDWICENVTYDFENLEDTSYTRKFSAYAALIDRTAVCQGYALLFYRLMLELNIDCRVIPGLAASGEAHGWNIVQLGDYYYNVDATWDAGQPEYAFFLTSTWNFLGHYRFLEYETWEFHEEYPMAAENYDPEVAAEIDPYIYYGFCGDDAYWLLYRDGTLEIFGTGSTMDANRDISSQKPEWVYWDNHITSVIIDEGITKIGRELFEMTDNLEEVTLPSTVTSIGSNAFYYCQNLKTVNFSEGLLKIDGSAFWSCVALDHIELPSTLTTIGIRAFTNCNALTEISIPASVTSIGYEAFSGCDALHTVKLDIPTVPSEMFTQCQALANIILTENVKVIQEKAFDNCDGLVTLNLPGTLESISGFSNCDGLVEVTIPEGPVIGTSAFSDCVNLEAVHFPESLTAIGTSAFSGCTNLATLDFPEGLTEIGSSAFKGCTKISELQFPAGLKKIGGSAFYDASVTTLQFPEGLTYIGGNAFGSCDGLTEITIPASVTSLSGFGDCVNLSSVTLYEGVETIGNSAFKNCTSLEEIHIPGTVKRISESAFRNSGLKSVELPDGLVTIDMDAFRDCHGLTEVVIPESVVDPDGFQNCDGLTTVYLNGSGTVQSYAFYGCSNLQNVYIGENIIRVNGFSYCTGLKEITVPDTVEGVSGFSGCKALETVYLHNTGGVIGYAFSGCNSLKNVEITNATFIGHQAFAGCAIERIEIPASVASIASYAFEGCEALKEIKFLGDCPEIDSAAFRGYGSNITATAYYPLGNETWTEDKLQNYGGTITWVPYGEECEHSYTSVVTEPTCEAGGYTTYTCTVCGDSYVDDYTDPVDHSYEDGACIWCGAQAALASGICGDDLTWVLAQDGTLTISGTGAMYDFEYAEAPWNEYLEEIKQVVIQEGATRIGHNAFREAVNMTAVSLSDTITEIGNWVFMWAEKLSAITLPQNLQALGQEAFMYCSSLEKIELPSSLTFIDSGVFTYCTSLTRVVIHGDPDIPSFMMGDAPFRGCTSLEAIEVDENHFCLKAIDGVLYNYSGEELRLMLYPAGKQDVAFEVPQGTIEIFQLSMEDVDALEELTIPDTVRIVAGFALSNCTNLHTIRFQGDAPTIRNYALSGVTATVYYPAGNETWTDDVMQDYGGTITWVEQIPENLASGTWGDNINWVLTFDGTLIVSGQGEVAENRNEPYPWKEYAEQIKKVIFEEGVTNVPVSAFEYYYPNLVSAELKSVEVIGSTAFAQCTALTSVILPDTLTEIDNGAFSCAGITTIEIHEGVTRIGLGAFSTSKLTEIVLPEGLVELGDSAFSGCEDLKSVYMPDSVTDAGLGVFLNCFSLETVNISKGLTFVNDMMFVGCPLKEIEIPEGIAWLGMGCFQGAAITSVTIPASVTLISSSFQDCTELKEITFLGDAPEMGSYSFTNVTATAYYPAGNATWTEEIRESCGSNITWVPYGEAEEETLVKWYSGTTSLNGTIDLNIYVLLSENLVNADDTYVRFTYADKVVDVPMAEALYSPTGDYTNRYRFSCPIYAKQLADSVNVKFMKGEEMIGTELNYSVKQYCENQINKSPDEKLVALCKALLNYGAAAQQLLNYNTENLANASLSDADKVLYDVDASDYKYSVTGSEDGIKAKSATLMLEDVVKVRVYFTLTGDKSIDDYTITIDGKAVTPSYNEKGWYVETDGIPGKDLEKMFKVQVGGITVEYGALSFVNSKVGGSNALESNISKALYAYWQAAEELLG